jgi:hypothetical protein
MNPLHRHLASACFPLTLAAMPAAAFTDGNAELKEAVADRSARVVVSARVAPPPTAWVPPAPKTLDGFRPPLRAEPRTTLARAEPPAPPRR